MFFWNSLAFSMIQQMLAIWSLVPLPFLKPAWTSGSSQFTYCCSLAWRILSIHISWGYLYFVLDYLLKSFKRIYPIWNSFSALRKAAFVFFSHPRTSSEKLHSLAVILPPRFKALALACISFSRPSGPVPDLLFCTTCLYKRRMFSAFLPPFGIFTMFYSAFLRWCDWYLTWFQFAFPLRLIVLNIFMCHSCIFFDKMSVHVYCSLSVELLFTFELWEFFIDSRYKSFVGNTVYK